MGIDETPGAGANEPAADKADGNLLLVVI